MTLASRPVSAFEESNGALSSSRSASRRSLSVETLAAYVLRLVWRGTAEGREVSKGRTRPEGQEKAAATHEPTAEERLEECMASWDDKTHITKSSWRQICQRQIKDNE